MQVLASPSQSTDMLDSTDLSLAKVPSTSKDTASTAPLGNQQLSAEDSAGPFVDTISPTSSVSDSSLSHPLDLPDPQPSTGIKKKGPSRSFSGFRSGHALKNKASPGKLWISVKTALHRSQHSQRTHHQQQPHQAIQSSPVRTSHPNPFKRGSSALPTLHRPWTSSLPVTSGPTQDQTTQPPLPARDTLRSHERLPFILDSSQGAAARQSARDYGKTPQQGSLMDENWALPRARESGISMCAPIDGVLEEQDAAEKFTRVSLLDPVSSLPAELSCLILSMLPASTLKSAEVVSHRWRKIATDPHLWRIMFQRDYGGALIRPPTGPFLPKLMGGLGIGKPGVVEQPWKRMYVAKRQLERRWETGEATAIRLNGHTDSVYCVQFDEHKIITGSRDRTIRVWSIQTGELLKVIGVSSAFESDRREQATRTLPHLDSHQSQLHVVDPHPPKPRHEMYHTPSYHHRASILCLQYDHKICVTGSSDCSLIVWRLSDWQPVHCLVRHKMGVLDVVFDAEKIVSCSKDSTICVWDRVTGVLLTQLQGHRGPVNAVQLRGNLVVSASGEGCAKLWRLGVTAPGTRDAAAHAQHIRDFWSQDRGLACVEFSDDACHVLAGGNDQVIYKFSAATGQLVDTLRGHTSLVRSLYLDGWNNRIVSGSYDFSLRVWDFERGVSTWCLGKWATSWTLSAKSDYRRIVCTNQDGRAMVVDFGWGVGDVGLLAGS